MGTSNSDKGDGGRPMSSDGAGGAENIGLELSDEDKNYAVQILTTEHFTLQTARSATISDSGGRASLFMSTVSSSLIALAFIGQMSQAGTAFNAFALLIIPTLFFLGLVTFQRVLQSAIEDTVYMSGINRIRHFHIELVPQTKKYFILSANDDGQGVTSNMSATAGWWQLFLTTAGTVMVINSILLGVTIGLSLRAFFDAQLLWIALGGLVAFGLSLAAHYIYQVKQWSIAAKRGPALFPSDPDKPQPGSQTDRANTS